MQNDVLKNTMAPWQEKGRWYHFNAVSDGNTWTINTDKSDNIIGLSILSPNFVAIGNDYNDYSNILDIKTIFSAKPLSGQTISIYYDSCYIRYGNTKLAVQLPTVAKYVGELDVYIFVI